MPYSFSGKGKVYLRRHGDNVLRHIGNCSALEFSVENNTITQPDFTTPGGGNANEIARVSSVGLNMTMLEFSPSNLALALRGVTSVRMGGAQTDERHTAYAGSLVKLNFTPDPAEIVTVTIDPDGTPSVAVAGTDYTLSPAGLLIPATGGAITDGTVIGVDYTSMSSDLVQAMTNSGDDYELVYEGLNEAESSKPVTVTVYRAKFSPTTGLGLITEEYGELPLEGSVLIDSTKSGAGISQYFTVDLVQ